jgi:hypothetical protein
MFARTASNTLRGSSSGPFRQHVRKYASPASELHKSKAAIYAAALLGVAAAGGAYYYYNFGPAKGLPPAEITLQGDDQWVDLKVFNAHSVIWV